MNKDEILDFTKRGDSKNQFALDDICKGDASAESLFIKQMVADIVSRRIGRAKVFSFARFIRDGIVSFSSKESVKIRKERRQY